MTIRAAIAAALVSLSLSMPAWADTPSKDSPYFETDAAGRSVMP